MLPTTGRGKGDKTFLPQQQPFRRPLCGDYRGISRTRAQQFAPRMAVLSFGRGIFVSHKKLQTNDVIQKLKIKNIQIVLSARVNSLVEKITVYIQNMKFSPDTLGRQALPNNFPWIPDNCSGMTPSPGVLLELTIEIKIPCQTNQNRHF